MKLHVLRWLSPALLFATCAVSPRAETSPTISWARLCGGDVLVGMKATPSRADTEAVYRLDLPARTFHRFTIPGAKRILAVSGEAVGEGVALLETTGGLALCDLSPTAPRVWSLPRELEWRPDELLLLGNRRHALVLGRNASSELRDGCLRQAPGCGPVSPGPEAFPSSGLLTDQKVYLGYAWGEWGGALLSMDLRSGGAEVYAATNPDSGEVTTSRIEPARCGAGFQGLPVSAIARGPDGGIHVLYSLAWIMSGRSQLISSPDGRQWQTSLLISSSEPEKACNWPFKPDTLADIAPAADGRLFVVGPELGLAVLERDSWKRLTPTWNWNTLRHDQHLPDGDGEFIEPDGITSCLIPSPETAVIAFRHSVVVCDQKTGSLTEIPAPAE